MASFDRTTILAGPCRIDFNGAEFFTQGAVILTLRKKTFDIEVEAFNRVDQRLDDREVEVTFTPDGRWNAASKANYFRGAGTVNGASWIGGTDVPMVITPLSGKPVTLHNAFLSKIPTLIFSANKMLIGPVSFMALGANNVDWSNAASLLTIGSSGSVTDFTGFSTADIITKGYTLTWGSKTGFVGIQTIDGITVDHNLVIEPFSVDSWGIVDYRFVRLDVAVKCKPLGPTEENAMAAMAIQDTGAARGASLNSASADIIIKDLAGTTVYTANSQNLVAAPFQWASKESRHGEYEWNSSREFLTGALVAPFVIA